MPILEPGRTKPFARTPVRCLVIVARDQVDLYHALQRAFGENEKVSVLLDRRREERRRGIHPVEANLRRMDRRDLPHVDDDFRLRKYVLVRPHYRRPHH